MFNGHYSGWVNSRMNGIKKYIGPEFFEGKTLLELGGGYGYNGNEFSKMGAIITSSDARPEYVEHILRTNSHFKHSFVFDCEKDALTENYDIILHWGVLYHLKEIDAHLAHISEHCQVLLLETEVADSDDPTFCIETEEDGFDQAFHSKGIRPSAAYVETVLQRNGFSFQRIEDPILNYEFHRYDWVSTNSGTWEHGQRRFWVCWKNVPSPLLAVPSSN